MKHLFAMPLLFALVALCVAAVAAQSAKSLENIQSQAELDKALTSLDAALFDAYNRCDLEKFASFFVENVEFYHDQGGVTMGRAALTESVKKNICGKVSRELVPGTLQVYYMKGYGAVEMGFIASTTRDAKIQSPLVKGNSFICGNTKMAHGKSPASSATTTTAQPNSGPSSGGHAFKRLTPAIELCAFARLLLLIRSPRTTRFPFPAQEWQPAVDLLCLTAILRLHWCSQAAPRHQAVVSCSIPDPQNMESDTRLL
jgi:hypothetical protein